LIAWIFASSPRVSMPGTFFHSITPSRIAIARATREQLEEAKSLRAEAEVLRDEYAAKIAGAESDAEAMMEGAKREAADILSKAEADSEAMIARRQRMAEEKIAAAEREAIAEVREKAADAAAKASHALISQRHDASADAKLADEVIGSL
ncbi:MAG: hypothetical protein AAFR88_09630, partial [Pseudomonadota bacterium]